MATATQSRPSGDGNQDFANYAPGFVNRFKSLPGARSMMIASGMAAIASTVAGPFQTGELPLWERGLFWTVSIAAVALAWRIWFAWLVTRPTMWLRATLAGAIAMSLAMPLFVAGTLALVGRTIGPNWWAIWPQSLAIALIIGAGLWLFGTGKRPTESIPCQGRLFRHGVTDPAILLRIESEDHYVRLFLADGRTLLVHEQFANLMAELDRLDGCVIRRGRWVASSSVAAVERHGRRISVRTRDGALIPVSPAGRDAMRSRGWI